MQGEGARAPAAKVGNTVVAAAFAFETKPCTTQNKLHQNDVIA